MKFNLKKINFRQPKYIFPLVAAIPLAGILYFTGSFISSLSGEEERPSDYINTELPEPKIKEENNKLKMMENRYRIDDAFGAVDAIGKESEEKETLDQENGYTEEEAENILRESSDGTRQLQEAREAEIELRRLQKVYNNRDAESTPAREYNPYKDIDEIQRRRNDELRAILNEPDPEEKERAERARIEHEQAQKEAMENPVHEVVKADNLSHIMFTTVTNAENGELDAPLIKAMIDRSTKTTDGTRLRFKLLDDVIIDDYKLKKGTYLYGSVVGFGTQRVLASITSILIEDKFLKVGLDVYDLDGMQGFYVPESSFREFMKNAASGIASQNINFSSTSPRSGIDGENIALQAIQNLYQSISSAVSGNLRKNKAKIKYNTIVYLINSKNN